MRPWEDPVPAVAERERESARGGEPDADAGEAPRADPDCEATDVRRVRARLTKERVDVLEQRLRTRKALAEHLVPVHESTRRDPRRGVESQCQHSEISTALPPPACRKRTAYRGGGKTPAPASGHSTKTIASSKYGSRSPHSAAEKPSKR